jgi:molybdenum-dependent DNA-binding transcriptional regulator ModE
VPDQNSPFPCGLLNKDFETKYRELFAELITFHMVVKLHGIQGAAEELDRPHSTVSARISKIESILEAEILNRTEHGKGNPTKLGQELLQFTDRVLRELIKMQTAIAQLKVNEAEVRVATIHSVWMAHGGSLTEKPGITASMDPKKQTRIVSTV